MSRLTQGPILDGDAIDAASLNDRYTQYSQSGALNQFNVRDAAFDLPQFDPGFLMKNMATGSIGYNEWKHAAYNTYTGQTTGASPYVVQDGVPSNTVLSLGTTGWTVTGNTDILRVYFDLSVRPRWEGTGGYASRPWTAPGTGLSYDFPFTGGGNTTVFDGHGCWAFWLQWDITSNALTNFVNVPGQGDFNSVVVASRGGELLGDIQATSVVPFVVEGFDLPLEGQNDSGILGPYGVGWTAVDGAWHRAQVATYTIYGLRVVFTGPFGGYHSGSNNYLLRTDTSIAGMARLDVQAGSINAVHMRLR